MNAKDEQPGKELWEQYQWTSAKEMLMRLPQRERDELLRTTLGNYGMILGIIVGLLLLPWLHIFHLHAEKAISLWMLFAILAGTFLCKRLPRYLGDEGCIELLGHIQCASRRHNLKPDGVFLHSGCQCVRCGYRPTGRRLARLH